MGDKIVNTDVIERLRSLYESISYSAVPKTVDLDIYFNIVRRKITLPDKTRVNGVVILDVKDGYRDLYNKIQKRQDSILNSNNNYDISD